MANAKPKAKAKSSARTVKRSRPNARRARAAVSNKAKPRRKHTFVASHLREEDFEGGLRRYAKYRDLGMSKATGGMV